MTLFYVPLEPYKERYTMQLSAPKIGWLERNWIKAGVKYQRIEGDPSTVDVIKTGVALDAVGRCTYAMSQIRQLLHLAESGVIRSCDTIYFDDFFHPGLEAIPYTFSQLGIKPAMASTIWAQSVDHFDFTYPMREWMRPIEKGYGRIYDHIFVACPTLKDLVVEGDIASPNKVHAVGHLFDSEEVASRMPKMTRPRQNNVVFSSRFDREKNPDFFMKVARRIMQTRSDIHFIVCTSAPNIRSNDPILLSKLNDILRDYPNQFFLKEGLSKEEYYKILTESKVQFNCSNQDWISYVLLEASVAGCFPVYPYFRSFPEVFMHSPAFMYNHLDLGSACDKILKVIDEEEYNFLFDDRALLERSWIHHRFDFTWIRELTVMGVDMPQIHPGVLMSSKLDPFSLSSQRIKYDGRLFQNP